mgnify:CR=1 FL=1
MGKRHTVLSNWSNKKNLFVFSLISYVKTEITLMVSWTKFVKSLGKVTVTVAFTVQSLQDKPTVFSVKIDRTGL